MKLKDRFAQYGESAKLKKLEVEKHRTERKAEKARKEQEQVIAEKQAIEDEKNRLLALDDKTLMVELIFAVRGFYSKYQELDMRCSELHDLVDELEDRIISVESDIGSLKTTQSEDN